MRIGDIVRARTVRNYGDGSTNMIHQDWTAPDGEVFLLVLVGREPRKITDESQRVTAEQMRWNVGLIDPTDLITPAEIAYPDSA